MIPGNMIAFLLPDGYNVNKETKNHMQKKTPRKRLRQKAISKRQLRN